MKQLAAKRVAGLPETGSLDGPVSHEGAVSPTAPGARAVDEQGRDLFAQLTALTTDPSCDDLFWQTRIALADELRPATFSELLAVSSLARDYVQLSRVQGMIEALQRPPALPAADAEKLRVLDEARQDQRLVREVMARLDAGEQLEVTGKQAGRLAITIVTIVAQVKEDVAASEEDMLLDAAIEANRERLGLNRVNPVPRDPDAARPPGRADEAGGADAHDPEQREGASEGDRGAVPDAAADEFERQELEQLEQLWALIRPVEKQFADPKHLAAVLEGRARIRPRELKGLKAALACIEEGLGRRHWVEEHRGLEQRLERLQHQALAAVAAEPKKLSTLCRLKAELEKSCERKLQSLRSRLGSRDVKGGLGVAPEATPAPACAPLKHQVAAHRRRPRATPSKRR